MVAKESRAGLGTCALGAGDVSLCFKDTAFPVCWHSADGAMTHVLTVGKASSGVGFI